MSDPKPRKKIAAAAFLGITLMLSLVNPFPQKHTETLVPPVAQSQETAVRLSENTASCPDTVKIVIHTYAGEIYTANGAFDVLQEGEDGGETVAEIHGHMEKQEDAQSPSSFDSVSETDDTIVLTVYTEDGIYGFYGDGNFYDSLESGIQEIEMYGYLVGYYDGTSSYTSS